MSRSPTRSRWRRLLYVQLAIWPLALVLAEVGFRAIQGARGLPYSSTRTSEELDAIARQNREFVPGAVRGARDREPLPEHRTLVHPYTGFELDAGLDQIDAELAFLASNPRDSYYAIAIFGGSVAQMFGQFGGERLLEVLRADPRFAGRAIHLFHFGRGGFRQPQQACLLAWLVTLGFDFDLVINLDGFNEVAIAAQNHVAGSHVAYPSVPHWGHLVAAADFTPDQLGHLAAIRRAQTALDEWAVACNDFGIHRSAIAGTLAMRRATKLRRACADAMARYAASVSRPNSSEASAGPRIAADRAQPIASAARVWRDGSRNMRALCEGLGMRYVHFLQPTLHDAGAKPMTAREKQVGTIATEWLQGVTKGYPDLRTNGVRLAHEQETFFDLSMVFANVEETLYIDACHVNKRGNELLANAVGEKLLGALPEDVGSRGRTPAVPGGAGELAR